MERDGMRAEWISYLARTAWQHRVSAWGFSRSAISAPSKPPQAAAYTRYHRAIPDRSYSTGLGPYRRASETSADHDSSTHLAPYRSAILDQLSLKSGSAEAEPPCESGVDGGCLTADGIGQPRPDHWSGRLACCGAHLSGNSVAAIHAAADRTLSSRHRHQHRDRRADASSRSPDRRVLRARLADPSLSARQHAAPLDGLAIIGLLVFAIAIMDGVTVLLMDRPEIVLTTAVAVFALNLGMQALATLAFAWRGLKTALSIGLCSGNRNLGILLAATADRATTDFLIVVALAQLPIYTLPMLQRWLYQRWLTRSPTTTTGKPAGRTDHDDAA